MSTSQFLGKAFERYFYDFSLHDVWAKQFIKDKGMYIGVRHVATCTVGLMGLIYFNFPFKPPFPTIGMCPSGWKGTWVCEPDAHKAMAMYKDWKAGVKGVEEH
eukprot:gene7252-363_t